eukprot:6023272-Alexandrium_andersonii.AAC.1
MEPLHGTALCPLKVPHRWVVAQSDYSDACGVVFFKDRSHSPLQDGFPQISRRESHGKNHLIEGYDFRPRRTATDDEGAVGANKLDCPPPDVLRAVGMLSLIHI